MEAHRQEAPFIPSLVVMIVIYTGVGGFILGSLGLGNALLSAPSKISFQASLITIILGISLTLVAAWWGNKKQYISIRKRPSTADAPLRQVLNEDEIPGVDALLRRTYGLISRSKTLRDEEKREMLEGLATLKRKFHPE